MKHSVFTSLCVCRAPAGEDWIISFRAWRTLPGSWRSLCTSPTVTRRDSSSANRYGSIFLRPALSKLKNLTTVQASHPFLSTPSSQCKPSRGRRRGICWCVDRFGVKVPGVNYAGGDLQCKDLDSSSNSNEWERAGRWAPDPLQNLPIKLAHFMTANQENYGTNAYIYGRVWWTVLFLSFILKGSWTEELAWVEICICRSQLWLPTDCVLCLRLANTSPLYIHR